MAATNFTPIQLYFSTTASAAPTAANLAQGELAINITDGKLYYEDNTGVVQVIATKGAGTIGGSTTQIQYNNAGALAGNAAMTFNSGTSTTTLTTLNLTNALGATYGGTAQSTYTQGDVLYSSAANTLAKLSIGAVNYILASTGSVPQWVAPSSIAVLTATNLAGGLAGSVPYQSALDTTTFLAIGAANRVMTSTGSAPQWVTSLTGLTGVSTTTLTTSSTVTINGGTANGVGYLDGSKVLTTGSALTFDGSTLIGTAADGTNNFKAKATTGVMRFTGYVSAFSGSLIESVNGAESSYAPLTTVGSYFAWNNGSEQMRLTSTGLGIGTSSPAYKLDVDRGASNGIVARLGRTSGQALYVFADTTSVFMGSDTSLATSISFNETNDNIELYTNNTRRALLDSAGNLGLGVTPSAWASNFKALQVGATVSLSAFTGNTGLYLGNNFYYDGANKFIGAGYASEYVQTGGAHQWQTSTISGANANDPVTFTQAMTLDASGNLGVGTTSPSTYGKFVAYSSGGYFAVDTNGQVNSVQLLDGVSAGGRFSGFSNVGLLGLIGIEQATTGSAGGYIRFNTSPSGSTSPTERARIDSSGNLLVGTTSASALSAGGRGLIELNGSTDSVYSYKSGGNLVGYMLGSASEVRIASFTAIPLLFFTNAAERARIDSSGNLLVGTTTASAKFSLEYNGSSVVGENINDSNDTANSTFVQFTVLGTQAGTIKRVASTSATVYNTTSDYRLKTVTGAVTGQGARIDALKPIDYQWKEGNTPARGFLAHEFQTVYSSSVSGDKDAVDADGKPVYQTMQASTSEVIADLVAELQSLRARVAQLESKP